MFEKKIYNKNKNENHSKQKKMIILLQTMNKFMVQLISNHHLHSLVDSLVIYYLMLEIMNYMVQLNLVNHHPLPPLLYSHHLYTLHHHLHPHPHPHPHSLPLLFLLSLSPHP
eukprot:UN08422